MKARTVSPPTELLTYAPSRLCGFDSGKVKPSFNNQFERKATAGRECSPAGRRLSSGLHLMYDVMHLMYDVRMTNRSNYHADHACN